jgi:DNA-binding transcriptional MerR regulator/methylmalonyl-CoA mutase cobalamin-binding subunit
MTTPEATHEDLTFSLGTVCQSVGISGSLIRSWERRHGAIQPARSSGGTRRFTSADVERLRLLKALVDHGYRIGKIAGLSSAELGTELENQDTPRHPALDSLLQMVIQMNAEELDRSLRFQLSALGPIAFAEEIGLPLLEEVGSRWRAGDLNTATEHLLSNSLRTLMGLRLSPTTYAAPRPTMVFATPSGERHEFGLLFAALVATSAGARVVYLGSDMPNDDLVASVATARAQALAISLVTLSHERCDAIVRDLRTNLPAGIPLIVGGPRSAQIPALPLVHPISRLDHLVQRIGQLSEDARL